MRYANIEERLLAIAVQPLDSDCWEWTGSLTATRGGNRYGRINVWEAGRRVCWWAHRLAYTVWRGPIPERYHVDHKCRNTVCINPAHLEAVPQSVNERRKPKR